MKKKEIKKEIFQFKILLVHSEPPIWRRFQVKSDISFDYFQSIIQVVMGWDNYHAYGFDIKKRRILRPNKRE